VGEITDSVSHIIRVLAWGTWDIILDHYNMR
jgi:hypothetical protein